MEQNTKNSEIAEKELKSRMRLFRQALKDEAKKNQLHDSIEGSEVMIRFEIYLPTKNPDKFVDGLFLYMNDEGKIMSAEYYLKNSEGITVKELGEKEFKVVKELFQDAFSLEVE
ncbi:hypothetical protein [Methanobacterium aggregans]|uniref:hypothetical protein n=1 Tax=Methanobacterium aggregans TaxID=1615586 RepID=UPI001FDA6BC1|nr:hypothetical protein [Methanobacterium aggregans]MBP2044886.1 hypothetical protein [Methanobacterium aggregans]